MAPALLSMLPGIASAAGGLFGMFGNKKKNNPANAANPYLDQIPGQMKQYYQPYMDAGNSAMSSLQGEYGKLMGDPASMYNKFAEGYKESPGYKFKLDQAMNAARNASAAGGMLGTPQDQQQAMQTATGIADQDFNDYMSQISGLYGKGLEGEQGIENQGFDANTSFANMLAQILGQKGMNAFTGQQGQNQANSQNWSNLFSGIGAAGAGYGSYTKNQQLMELLKHMGGQ